MIGIIKQWKSHLLKRVAQFGKAQARERLKVSLPPKPYELGSKAEIYAFLLGAAAAMSVLCKRPITEAEADELIDLRGLAGGNMLVLESLDDWDAVRATITPSGETTYPLIAKVTVAEEVRRKHNHSICCPGCDDCPNVIRRNPVAV